MGDTPAAPALAVGVALMGMQMTSTLHPPAGGTALIAAVTGQSPFFVVPVLIGSVTQVGVALIFNNMVPNRRYPQHW